VPAPHTFFEHANRPGDDDWQTVEAALAVRGGIAYRADLDGHSAALVAQLGRRQPLGRAVEAAAAERSVSLDAFEGPAITLVRSLIHLGFFEFS
jgi:hypothetical protein